MPILRADPRSWTGCARRSSERHLRQLSAGREDESEVARDLLRRRTQVIRIFPNPASCPRLIRALAVETFEGWLEDSRYLNMEYWWEHRRQVLRQAG